MKKKLSYNSLTPPKKISTKLSKIHTFPYRNSEFHTIHDLENSILFQVFHTEYDPCLNMAIQCGMDVGGCDSEVACDRW